MLLRAEKPADYDAIDYVVRQAFGQEDEVGLVHEIRNGAGYVPALALVADEDRGILGHIMLSYAKLGPHRVLQLAPLAVRPDKQRQGIGDALTRCALELADEQGEPLVIVLGHPDYYPRFGFGPARQSGIEPEIPDLPDDVWMVKHLSAYDASLRGTAIFPLPAT
jgi:putative acetyltransferase